MGEVRRRSVLLCLLALLTVATPVVALTVPVDDYAGYEPQTVCRTQALPGTQALARWVNRSFAGGTAVASLRSCTSGGASEHKDGRAIDWRMSARSARDRATVAKFLNRIFAADAEGNPHALARRMGVMYVIWNDRMYASYRQFEPRAYLSSSCTSLRSCSPTLRHRDHVHISLSHDGGRGLTSWYAGRL